MGAPQRVLDFYANTSMNKIYLTNDKTIRRHVSYAENVFSAQMLAIALFNENKDKYGDLDLPKVVSMLSLLNIPVVNLLSMPKDKALFQDNILDTLGMKNELRGWYNQLSNSLTDPNGRYALDVAFLVDEINDKKSFYETYSDNILVVNKDMYKFYNTCNKLRDVIRTGWKDWKVSAPRLESVAEHIHSTQMLAIAIYSEYPDKFKNLDLNKVLLMIAIHELGETVIGDLTIFQIDKKNKKAIEQKAVHDLLKDLDFGYDIESLYLEFDNRSTPEGIFAHWCDKEDCVLQATLYDEGNYVDLNHQKGNKSYFDKDVQRLLAANWSFKKLFIDFWNERVNYDEAFLSVSDYAYNQGISHLIRK